MKVQDRMKEMVDTAPDIALVAFCDVSSGLILNWAGKSACPREVLDQLGEKAAACFAMLDRHVPDGVTGVFGTAAIHFTERGSQIFARNRAQAEDVICVDCAAGAPLEARLRGAMTLADKVAEAE